MIEGNLAAVYLQFGQLSVQRDLRVIRGDLAKQKDVAVVVAKDGVDRAVEAFRQRCQRERRTEVPEKEQHFRSRFGNGTEDAFQMVEAVVNVTEDG